MTVTSMHSLVSESDRHKACSFPSSPLINLLAPPVIDMKRVLALLTRGRQKRKEARAWDLLVVTD